MNIFEYEGKEFDKKLDEIFKDINKEKLKQELIECGLKVKEINYGNKSTENMLEQIKVK